MCIKQSLLMNFILSLNPVTQLDAKYIHMCLYRNTSSPPLPIPCLLFPPLFRSLSSCLCIFYLPPFLSFCLFLWVKTASLVNIASSLKKPRRGLLELSRTCASISLIPVLTKQSCFVLVTVLPLA